MVIPSELWYICGLIKLDWGDVLALQAAELTRKILDHIAQLLAASGADHAEVRKGVKLWYDGTKTDEGDTLAEEEGESDSRP